MIDMTLLSKFYILDGEKFILDFVERLFSLNKEKILQFNDDDEVKN